jgi:hypothetical protein
MASSLLVSGDFKFSRRPSLGEVFLLGCYHFWLRLRLRPDEPQVGSPTLFIIGPHELLSRLHIIEALEVLWNLGIFGPTNLDYPGSFFHVSIAP